VYAVNSGIIQSLFIKEGDTVQKNQVLAMISADNQKLNLDNASLNLEKSRENYQGQESLLGNIKNEMESMQKKLQLDSLNYFRQKLLWEQNIGSKTDLENKKLKYENAVDNLHLLKQKYRQASLDLKNSFLQSRNILKKEKLVLNDYTVRSKMNGIVYSLFKNE
jgi:HlyD family secretion protein